MVVAADADADAYDVVVDVDVMETEAVIIPVC